MKLWIRSQDRLRLSNVCDIRIYYAEEEKLWVIEDCDDLAYYKTKERALEVLDEIQKILNPKLIVKEVEDLEIHNFEFEFVRVPQLEYDIEKADTYVYEMPKE